MVQHPNEIRLAEVSGLDVVETAAMLGMCAEVRVLSAEWHSLFEQFQRQRVALWRQMAEQGRLTLPCDGCGKRVAVNKVDGSYVFCSEECGELVGGADGMAAMLNELDAGRKLVQDAADAYTA